MALDQAFGGECHCDGVDAERALRSGIGVACIGARFVPTVNGGGPTTCPARTAPFRCVRDGCAGVCETGGSAARHRQGRVIPRNRRSCGLPPCSARGPRRFAAISSTSRWVCSCCVPREVTREPWTCCGSEPTRRHRGPTHRHRSRSRSGATRFGEPTPCSDRYRGSMPMAACARAKVAAATCSARSSPRRTSRASSPRSFMSS